MAFFYFYSINLQKNNVYLVRVKGNPHKCLKHIHTQKSVIQRYMEKIKIADKTFTLSITHEEILHMVKDMASMINKDLQQEKPLFICILSGAFMFFSDLMKKVNIECDMDFVKLSSYKNMLSTGKVDYLTKLAMDIQGRTVVVVEDIIETGNTLEYFLLKLQEQNPAEIKIATLFIKQAIFKNRFSVDYTGIETDNPFIVGYGLDYNEQGRNLKDIYKLSD